MSRGGGAQHKWVSVATKGKAPLQRCSRCGCERYRRIEGGRLTVRWTYFHAGATSQFAGECMGGLEGVR